MVRIIRELKALGFKLYVMSNISAPDYEYLRENVPMDWTLFDGIFISAEAHLRKPEIGFFKNVLSDIRAEPSRVLFVDDKFNNVLSARSTGMYGIVHSSSAETIRQLSNLCLNPITRAQSWLQLNKGKMLSVTSTGHTLDEIFSPLLIVEATGDHSLTKPINIVGQTNFFVNAATMTTDTLPNDLDTTSIGLLSSCAVSDSAAAHKVMDEMLQFKNEDGILQVYFDSKRPRIDPIVCTNVLTLFYRFGRGHQLKDTFAWVQDTLRHRAYTDGTPYYATAEAFLYFLGRLINESAEVRRRIGALFESHLKERFGLPGDALALAMRLLAAAYIDPSLRLLRTGPACVDAYRLRQLQSIDGSWAGGWLYRYGSSDIAIQNHGLTTAFGLKALAVWNEGKSGEYI
ncbi:Haloacid dehalogenase-like hydrolase-domain-containing protein, partial [Infundibulicybe gibba]